MTLNLPPEAALSTDCHQLADPDRSTGPHESPSEPAALPTDFQQVQDPEPKRKRRRFLPVYEAPDLPQPPTLKYWRLRHPADRWECIPLKYPTPGAEYMLRGVRIVRYVDINPPPLHPDAVLWRILPASASPRSLPRLPSVLEFPPPEASIVTGDTHVVKLERPATPELVEGPVEASIVSAGAPVVKRERLATPELVEGPGSVEVDLDIEVIYEVHHENVTIHDQHVARPVLYIDCRPGPNVL